MADNVQSMMLDILKRIQADVSDVKVRVAGIEGRIEVLDGRMERVETALKKQSRDSAAILVMMRSTVGAFDERVGKLEEEIRLIREHE